MTPTGADDSNVGSNESVETMKRRLMWTGALALAAIAFACTADALPCASCLRVCLNQCWYRGGSSFCVARCQRYYGSTARAATARRTGPVLHGGYTNPTGPTSTHKH
jgi:hypothetical protein